MLSEALGSKCTLFLIYPENCLKCGIYSSKMDSSLHSKEKVGSIDQKMMMKKNVHVYVSLFFLWFFLLFPLSGLTC